MPSPYNNLSLSLYGGSHEKRIGAVLKGAPVGYQINLEELQKFTDRRKSGRYAFSTPRIETDTVNIERGLENGVILGDIEISINNENIRPSDYGYSVTPRPSHADYVAAIKYGSAPSGGGSFSGRMTAPLCAMGGIAKQLLASKSVQAMGYISEIGGMVCSTYDNGTPNLELIRYCHDSEFPVLEKEKITLVKERLSILSAKGDSAGGVIECIVYGVPVGLGGIFDDGLEGRLAMALYGIPAVKSVEFGKGRGIAGLTGSVANDPFEIRDGKVVTTTNNSGGINGGISNGMPITVRVAFRPTPSIAIEQRTVNLKTMENTLLHIKGRHDAAFLPRAIPAVESAVSLVILDAMLDNNLF